MSTEERREFHFRNRTGREFRVPFHILAADRVREGCDVDLMDTKAGVLYSLPSDLRLAAAVLWHLVRDDIDAGLSEEEFYKSLDGDSIECGIEALWEAYEDFCPKKVRSTVSQQLDVARQARRKTVAKTLQVMDEVDLPSLMDQELDSEAERVKKEISELFATDSPESAGSTP